MNTLSHFLSKQSITHVCVAATIPDAIRVNGRIRPTKNSNGKPIYPTLEGIKNFWAWFGDSEVVDEHGRPVVYYHGTAVTTIKQFSGDRGFAGHFTDCGIFASEFAVNRASDAEDNIAQYGLNDLGDAANVYPVYIKALKVFDAREKSHWDSIGVPYDSTGMAYYECVEDNAAAILKKYDAAFDFESDGGEPTGLAVMSANQIKSALGNNGAFSHDRHEITASHEATAVSKKDKLKAQQKAAQNAPPPVPQAKAAKQTVVSLNLAKVDGLSEQFASYATALLDALAKGTPFTDISGKGVPVEGGGTLRTQLNRMTENQALRSVVYAKLTDDANNKHWRFYYDVASTAVALLDIFDKDGNKIDKQQIERLIHRSRVFRSNYK